MPIQFAHYWFTKSRKPNWRPIRPSDYNPLFLSQLEQVHQTYQLNRKRFGFSTSDYLREVFVREHIAYARLAQLDWSGYTKHHPGYITLHFKLELELFVPVSASTITLASRVTPEGKQVEFTKALSLPFVIHFENNYPAQRPRFDLNRKRLAELGIPERRFNNVMTNYLCVMNNAQDWVVGENNNMVTAIDCLVDWMADNHFCAW